MSGKSEDDTELENLHFPLFDPGLLGRGGFAAAPARPVLPAIEGRRPGRFTSGTFFWKCLASSAILLAPLVAYWPTIFHYYGLRDSYSNLREAHEEPGKLVRFCASHARPIYGWLLETTLRRIDSIAQLQWLRMTSALLLGAISLSVFRLLRRTGWSVGARTLLAIWLGLVPSAQVMVGWAIAWPYSIAVLAALGAFWLAETAGSNGRSVSRRLIPLAGAVMLMAASALTYQPSALFYAVPLAAVFIARRSERQRDDVRWAAVHVAVTGAGLTLAYAVMQFCYTHGIFQKSARIDFEQHWGGKLLWFVREPVSNALGVFVINDDRGLNRPLYLAGVTLAALILAAGACMEWRRRGWQRGLLWLTGLFGLPVFSFAVNLLASERYATYRTIFALTGVLLCFLIASVRSILTAVGSRPKRMAALVVIAAALVVARQRAFALLAVPQGNEWRLVLDGAAKVKLSAVRPTIFAIQPTPADISTVAIYHDEFGSLSSNSDWVPREMFKRAMHDLHPQVENLDRRYRFASGERPPAGLPPDVLIDMRRLKDMRKGG